MSGGAPAAEADGASIFLSTANGTFDASSGQAPADFAMSVLRLGSGGEPLDWFTPFNEASLSGSDKDLGSGGVVLLPDQSVGPPHLMVAGGKQGRLYLINRDAMGHYCASCTAADTNVVESFMAAPGFFCTPVFWQNALYFAGSIQGANHGDHLKRLLFHPATGQIEPSPASQSGHVFNFPGATPSISSEGEENGIVWVVDSSHGSPNPGFQPGPAVLFAYDATDLSRELWDSSQAENQRDQAANAVKFSVPTVANGRVYLGTATELDVYGLFGNATVFSAASPIPR